MRHAYAALLLALGFASGAASAGIYCTTHAGHSVTDIPSRTEQLEAMSDEVGLDAAQRIKILEIANKSHAELVKVRASAAPALAAIRTDVRSQMRAVMTPEQRARFDAYCARRDAQRSHADD